MPLPAAYDPRHSLNAICPYFTMFPLEFPLGALSRVPDSGTVVDPFCGRGTTLYAARATKRQTFGVDCSSVAVAISKAKLATASKSDVLDLARNLLEHSNDVDLPRGRFWRLAYKPTVLKKICALRMGLLTDTSHEAAILRALVMGVLHGPVTGVGSYLSNQMQRTFAPKPDYAVQFWTKRDLKAPKVDVLAAIERKADHVFRSPAFDFQKTSLSDVAHGDAGEMSTWKHAPAAIDAVITSPPYYGMRTYVPDQWLRNWFVGGPDTVDYSDDGRVPSSSPDVFAKGLAKVWDRIGAHAGDCLHMFVRFGVLPSRKIDARELLFQSFEESRYNWKRVYTKSASTASKGRRQAAQMREPDTAETEFDTHLRLI